MNILSFINIKLFQNGVSPLIKRGLIVIILLSLNINLFSQSYPFRHFTVEDGLPSSETYHVFQDSKGYIWIATDNGVSRYDGYEFKNFTQQDGLPDNTVFEIFEDYKNRIWFIPHSAKLSYFLNDSIYEYEYNDTLQSRMNRGTSPIKLSFYVDSSDRVIYSDKRNDAYIVNSAGFIRKLNPSIKGIVLKIIENKIIYNITNDNTNAKLFFTIIKNDSIIFKTELNTSIYNFSDCNFPILNNESILIADHNRLFDFTNLSDISFRKLETEIIWISFDNCNNLWLGTRSGALCYENLNISKPKQHLLNDKNISSVLHDKEGGFWFSTLYDGIYYLPNIYTTTLRKQNGLPSDDINTLTSDSSHLWLGLHNKVVGIKSDTINKEISLDKNNIITNKIYSDFKNQKLWIGAISLYSYQNNYLLKHIYKYKETLATITFSVQTKDIIVDNNNAMWVATGNGMYRYNRTENYFLTTTSLGHKINTICQKQTDKFILCGCNNGLWEYSIVDDTFKYLGNKNKLLSGQIDCIISNTYHNNMWLGTKSNGIVVYDNDEIYNLSTKDGLSNNSITSLYLKENVMWVTTRNGLNKITFQDKELKYSYKIESFNKIHGLASNETNDIYVSDSSAYIATKQGLTIIDINKIKTNNFPPPIFIKNITIQAKDTTFKDHYILPYNQNSISIEYVGLMYRNNENRKYKYQFYQAGKKTSWVETNENYVNLSYLPPGKYTFNVIAINEDNTESVKPAQISFTITPPYWKTWWFIVSTITLVLFLIYILYRTRIRELNKRNRLEKNLLKEVNKFRQKTLSQQMNPHFIFNTLNSIQYYIYNNDVNSSTKYLTKFSKLMRLILDNSQHDTIPIQKELDALDLYLQLESLRLDENFKFEIIVNSSVDTQLYKIYPLLIQPYVENSIWHGLVQKGEKMIKIEILPNDDSILCKIEDNGIGREKALERKKQKEKQKSHGTNITNKRIETINKLYNRNFKVEFIDLKDTIGSPSGTRVLLQIPKITD